MPKLQTIVDARLAAQELIKRLEAIDTPAARLLAQAAGAIERRLGEEILDARIRER